MPDDYQPSALTHGPCPYVVRIRFSVSEDSAPTTTEVRTVALSPLNAACQAALVAVGMSGVEGQKFAVEAIDVDFLEYYRLLAASMVNRASR